MEILIGADPEVFVFNPNSGTPLSAFGLIPGTKSAPVLSPTGLGATQVDGMALEFNIRPETEVSAFTTNVRAMMKELGDKIVDTGYKILVEPSVIFPDGYVQEQPEMAQTLGCDPDFCGWTGSENPRPDASLNMRTAAGHIHIGWTNGADIYDTDHFELCCALARHLDYCLGIYSLLWDGDFRRRTMYGKAACFRPKPYGIEYRTLSNAWLKALPLQYFVFKGASEGTRSFFDGSFRPEAQFGDVAQDIINDNRTEWQQEHPEIVNPFAKTVSLHLYKSMHTKAA